MPYGELVELALYHPVHGFYSGAGKAGRRGDFITSPEVGPLFGHLVGRALDAEWNRLGQPSEFTVVDYGAGPGTLARSIADGEPACSQAWRYLAIERSEAQRAEHPDWVMSHSSLEDAAGDDPLVGVVIANELLDNLAFTPIVSTGGRLHEVVVDVGVEGLTHRTGVELSKEQRSWFADGLSSGTLQDHAAQWLSASLDRLSAGRVIVLDYARLSSSDVEVRTYAEHGRAGDPLTNLGNKDITIDVDLAQLQARTRRADRISSQADWLDALGMGELVAAGRKIWDDAASIGDLAALKARSRIREAEALADPAGLGAFFVAEWIV